MSLLPIGKDTIVYGTDDAVKNNQKNKHELKKKTNMNKSKIIIIKKNRDVQCMIQILFSTQK